MKIKYLFILSILIVTGVLNAQTDFRPGYIIKLSGDTLKGKIDYQGDLLMSSICVFKVTDNTINEYLPNDIISYRFIDSKFYISKEIYGKRVFLEYLIKGKVNIYYMRDDNGDHYYLDKDDVKLTEILYDEGFKYVDNKQVSYYSTDHNGLLNYFMQDAPELKSRILKLKKPGHQNLIKLAEDYHNTVCKGEKCIIYHKNAPWISVIPELVVGVINYPKLETVNEYNLRTGMILHVWMPRSNEKMYFKTGLIFQRAELSEELIILYKVPLQFEYLYPKGLLRPRVAYGLNMYYTILNMYYTIFHTVSLDFGALIRVNESIFISVSSEFEFNQKAIIIPSKLGSYSFNLGFLLKL